MIRDALRRLWQRAPDAGTTIQARNDDISESLRETRDRANAAIAAGDLAAAEGALRTGLATWGDDAQLLLSLGFVLKEQGGKPEARLALERCLQCVCEPADRADAWYLLGQLAQEAGNNAGAENAYRSAMQSRPDFLRACKDLCRLLHASGQSAQVQSVLEACVVNAPQCVEFRLWLADIYENEFDFDGVVRQLRCAVALGARKVDTLTTLAAAEYRMGYPGAAAETFDLAVSLDPGVEFEAHYHRGYFLVRTGDLDHGVQALEQAIVLKPDFFAAHSLLLMALSYVESSRRHHYQQAAMRFAQAAGAQVPAPLRTITPASPNGTLRIGFVSGDFRTHPVVHFLRGVLEHLNRSLFHVVAYSDNVLEDVGTRKIRPLFDAWHSIQGMSDQQATEMIRAHGMDVLFDLGGHTGGGRLPLFAWRPATVQVTWLGYFASTGLAEMDFVLGDDVSIPVDTTEWFSEMVFRMPDTRLCMATPDAEAAVPIAPPPSVQQGWVTFGVFQQVGKISMQTIAVWNRLLHAMPTARLRIQGEGLQVTETRRRLEQNMASLGMDMSRVTLLAPDRFDAYLHAHNEVDVLLDTYPYPGGTTTAWGLWMGVPTVSMVGDTMLARQGLMMLRCVGLERLCAAGDDAYLRLAVEVGRDVEFRAMLRRDLRQRALNSPLFDNKRFALAFEKAILDMVAQIRSPRVA